MDKDYIIKAKAKDMNNTYKAKDFNSVLKDRPRPGTNNTDSRWFKKSSACTDLTIL
jgi:hypothetical protein